MQFKYCLSILLILAIYPNLCAQKENSDVQWASTILGVSSQFESTDRPQDKQFRAEQVLGKPDKLPAVGESPCAWSPAKEDNPEGEWIKVGFHTPMRIAQIIIAENFNPGAVTQIFLYDIADREYKVYQNPNVAPLMVKGRMFPIIQKTDYEVKALKIVMNTAKIPGFNQIDAIGISSSANPVVAKINTPEKPDFEIKSKPQNLGVNINSEYQEIAPMVTPDGKMMFFTRSRHPQNIGNPQKQDVWYAEIKADGTFGIAKNIGPPINTPQHNSSFSISPDDNTMLLNNIYNADGTLEKGLSITRKQKDGTWSKPEKIVIDDYYNKNDYSEFCLSQDGKILLMTVQRADSYGGKDIYFSRTKGDGGWTVPKNLGSKVNTASSETSPFLASDGKTLYFSTGGLSGFGSNDIFVSRRLDDTWTNWSDPQNLGAEINTPEWDAYFSIPAKADFAYYTSYDNSMGDSDIFRVKLSEPYKPEPVALIKGKVFNAVTKEPIAAQILYEILPAGENAGKAGSNPQTGDYQVVLPLKKNYGLLAEAKGYLSVDENINLTDSINYVEITKDLYLVPIEDGTAFKLNNIFFARTEFYLLPESYPELNRLAQVLKDNPNMVIQLEGHTEVFGKPKDQKNLAENRVKTVKRYLMEKGSVKDERIKLKSFGGSRPLCTEVTEECRSKNRRVEVRILKH